MYSWQVEIVERPDGNLEADFVAGLTLQEVCDELVNRAERTGKIVHTNVNGTSLIASPGVDAKSLYRQYWNLGSN